MKRGITTMNDVVSPLYSHGHLNQMFCYAALVRDVHFLVVYNSGVCDGMPPPTCGFRVHPPPTREVSSIKHLKQKIFADFSFPQISVSLKCQWSPMPEYLIPPAVFCYDADADSAYMTDLFKDQQWHTRTSPSF